MKQIYLQIGGKKSRAVSDSMCIEMFQHVWLHCHPGVLRVGTLRCGRVSWLAVTAPPPLGLGDSELRRWSTTGRVFRASTRPQHVGPNNKNKHPGVELVPQCEDLNEEHVELPRHTVRGNPILHSLCFSPFSISLPPSFLPFFLAHSPLLRSLHFLSCCFF